MTRWLLLISLAACTTTQAANGPVSALAPVRVQQLVEREHGAVISLQGVTRAVDRAQLGFAQGGRVEARSARVGAHLERGAPVARLETDAFRNQLAGHRASLAQLEAQLGQLQRERDRLQPLVRSGSVAAAELERTVSQVDGAQAQRAAIAAQVEESRRQLADAVLTAPFSGVVAAVHVQPGEVVAAGQPVVELVGSTIEVAVEVPEDVWVQLTSQTPVTVVLPALQLELEGEIVDLAASGGSRGLFPVVVRIPTGPQRVSGLTARVDVQLPLRQGLVAPLSAIVDPIGSGPSVFVLREGSVHRVPVTIGALTPQGVQIDGLSETADVVVAGQAMLVDGQRVEVARD